MNKGNFFATLKLYLVSRCLAEHSDLTKYQEYCENEVLHFVWYDDGDPRVKNLQSNMIFDAGSRIHGEKDNYVEWKLSQIEAISRLSPLIGHSELKLSIDSSHLSL